jgi:hypothetical protein
MNDIQIELNPNTLYRMLDNESTNNNPNNVSKGVLEKVYNYLTIRALFMIINDKVLKSKNIYGVRYV